MKAIPLTRGMFATVDDDDYERIFNMGKWQANDAKRRGLFYAQMLKMIGGKKVCLLMHRVVINAPPGQKVDHKDRNGLNNSKSNLRLATNQQNLANGRLYENNTSGSRGVYWKKNSQKWAVAVGGKYAGSFTDKNLAAAEYNRIAKSKYGDFAYANSLTESDSD